MEISPKVKTKNRALNYLKEIFYLLGKDRKKLPWLILLFLVSSMLDLAGLGLIGPYVVVVMSPEKLIQGPLGQFFSKADFSLTTNDLLIIFSLGLVGIFLFKAIVGIFINWKILRFSMYCRVNLQTYLMQSYQQQPYTDYLQRNTSEYIQSIQELAAQFTGKVLQSLLRLLSEGIVSLFVLTFLAVTNGPVLALLVTLLGVAILSYDRFFRYKVKLYGERASEGVRQMVQGIHEGIGGFKELRILGKALYFHQLVSKSAKESAENSVKASLISNTPRYLLEFILITFVVLFVVWSLILGADIKSIVPTLGVFSVASLRLIPSANLLIRGITQLRFGRYATHRLYKDIKQLEKYGYNESVLLPEQSPEVPFSKLVLKGVSFRYSNAKQQALRDIDLYIKSGESIGIIGPSGGGKTTLVDVILGLLKPQEGEVFYNNHPINEALSEWRMQVAYLPQEVFLIDNTLRRNVALGITDSKIDDLRIYEALRQARLIELVEQLPQGIDTLLGERGVRLSGGQRQRVALARAFYHGRNVLVLDEATSSLDHETERQIVEEIKYLKGQKTLIVIAHRLTTVEHCDRIYRLEQGRIVGIGSYDQVINKKKTVGA